MTRRPIPIFLVFPAVFLLAVASLIAQSGDYWVEIGDAPFRTGVGAPSARNYHSTTLVRGKIFVWGGQSCACGSSAWLNTGGVYDPVVGVWEQRPNLASGVGAPSARIPAAATAANGKVLIIGGGGGFEQYSRKDGGIYDIDTDTWSIPAALQTENSQVSRRLWVSIAHCEGDKAYVWGGTEWVNGMVGGLPFPLWTERGVYDGNVFDFSTNAWTNPPTLTGPVAHPQFCGPGVWIGNGFISRGGDGGSFNVIGASDNNSLNGCLAAGGRFDLDTLGWASTPVLRTWDGGRRRSDHSAVWTGELYLEFGGGNHTPNGTEYFNTGMAYDPDADSFVAHQALDSGSGAPFKRAFHLSVWTGAHMLVWGGSSWLSYYSWVQPHTEHLNNGGLYDPLTDTWSLTSALTTNSARSVRRSGLSLVFDGSRAFLWGGSERLTDPMTGSVVSVTPLNTGAIYVPPRVAPSVQSPVPVGNTPTTWAQGGIPPGGAVVQVGQFWRHRITAYGCPVPDVAFTGLAPWMSVKKLDTGAFIQGTPTANDAHTASLVTVFADNGIGNFATQSFIVSVTDPAAQIAFQNRPGGTAYVGVAYSYSALNSGIVPTSLSITAKLVGSQGMPSVPNTPNWPSWLSWNGITLSGTPPAGELGKQYDFQILATQGQVYGYQRFTVTVALPTAVSFAAADVNDDNLVDVVDVQLLVNWILAVTPPPSPQSGQPIPGDVNQDAVRDVVDVQAVVNKILSP